MLRLRICPKCGNKIVSLTALFCYHCGEQLPPPQGAGREKGEKEGRVLKKAGGGRPFFGLKGLVAFLLLAGFVSGGLFLAGEVLNSRRPAEKAAAANEAVVEGFSFPLAEQTFGEGKFEEITPAGVDFFLESRLPSVVLAGFLSKEAGKEFREKTGLEIEEAQSYLEDDFALIKLATASAFLGKIKSKSFVAKKVDELAATGDQVAGGDYDFKPYILGSYLVVTNSSDLYARIKAAGKKLRLNLGMLAAFAEGKRLLPEKGQVFIFSQKRNFLKGLFGSLFGRPTAEILFPKLRGRSFVVLRGEGGRTLVRGVPYGK